MPQPPDQTPSGSGAPTAETSRGHPALVMREVRQCSTRKRKQARSTRAPGDVRPTLSYQPPHHSFRRRLQSRQNCRRRAWFGERSGQPEASRRQRFLVRSQRRGGSETPPAARWRSGAVSQMTREVSIPSSVGRASKDRLLKKRSALPLCLRPPPDVTPRCRWPFARQRRRGGVPASRRGTAAP